jgi:hypothetical protein
MKIDKLFERDIFRPINGVVKADQLDESSVWQELDEFVITKELDQHLRQFVSWFLEGVDPKDKNAAAGKMGIWISGFFGSGKSHFLKVLSYLLHNQPHTHAGQTKQAVEFFESKVKDALLFGDIKRAVAADTDVALFNIDSKADHRTGRDLILRVFLRVLNELQGYSGDHPHLAHLERYLASKGILQSFQESYRKHTGLDWTKERDAYQFNRDEVVKALAETLGQSQAAAEKWIDGAEDTFPLTVENFCKWVKEYLDSKGTEHRLAFLVDEVGQFIGTDSHLMLNLQTITEELGTICQRRAWVMVTSQEDMDTVLGDMTKTKRQDFSKIQGRFYPPLSLSSANVDEVIQTRLLAKVPDVKDELEGVFTRKGDILKNQLTFTNCGMTFKKLKSPEEFARNYPFVPYQFQLLQKIFEAIRKAGATGMHLARGERSMLDAFQSAAKTVSNSEIGVLVPLYEFYPSIESFLDTAVKKTIDQAKTNSSLEPADVRLLQVLFLIRYVDEMKGNVDNLVTLCLDEIDGDRLVMRRRTVDSLARLEKETLISRNGEDYFFLTNEERDINKEIKAVELSAGDEAKLLGEIVFDEVLKGQRKHRFSGNKMDFEFNRRCDDHPVGNQKDGALFVQVITPLADDYESYEKPKCILDSAADGGLVLIRLANDEGLGRELRTCVQTTKYLARKNDGTLSESTRRILRESAEGNRQRRDRLTGLLGDLLSGAAYFAAGQPLKLKSSAPVDLLDEAMEYLIQNSFNKMSYLKRLTPEADRPKEIQSVLRSNDVAKEQLLFEKGENNPEAIEDLRSYLELASTNSRQVVLHDMIEKRYALRPYGWPDDEVLLLIARLLVLGDVSLMMDGALVPIEKVYESISAPAKRRKIVVVRRHAPDPDAVRKARHLGKELFAEMGPDGADGLCAFLQGKLRDWQANLNSYKPMADTGDYPGKAPVADGLTLISKLVSDKDSLKFIERFNLLSAELLDFADPYHDLEHFYGHQRVLWEKLRKASAQFQLNRLELERDAQASPALARLHEILAAACPYGMLKEGEGLIRTVGTVNSAMLADRRQQAIQKIDGYYGTLAHDVATVTGDASLRLACLKPLELLRQRVEREESLAHITQAETEAVREFDASIARIEEFSAKQAEKPSPPKDGPSTPPAPVVKKQRIIRPAELAKVTYLETPDEVTAFLDALRLELEKALANNERVQIR